MSDSITVNPATVAQWRAQLKQATADVARLTKQIELAETLGLAGAGPTLFEVPDGRSRGNDNMTAAIEEITKTNPPLDNKTMKKKLRGMGFPEERLANYYYTAVQRLAVQKRIVIWPDKRVGAVQS